jgi:hypothetical protein
MTPPPTPPGPITGIMPDMDAASRPLTTLVGAPSWDYGVGWGIPYRSPSEAAGHPLSVRVR